jgi:TM2 domain-containing membrane protein YozV
MLAGALSAARRYNGSGSRFCTTEKFRTGQQERTYCVLVDAPAKLQKRKSLRFAATLNLVVPGAGQFYLGQRVFGCVLAAAFLTCFVAMIALFLRGYVEYLRAVTGGDILESNALEQLGTVFHVRWLIGLLVVSIVIFVVSMIGLAVASKSASTDQTPSH